MARSPFGTPGSYDPGGSSGGGGGGGDADDSDDDDGGSSSPGSITRDRGGASAGGGGEPTVDVDGGDGGGGDDRGGGGSVGPSRQTRSTRTDGDADSSVTVDPADDGDGGSSGSSSSGSVTRDRGGAGAGGDGDPTVGVDGSDDGGSSSAGSVGPSRQGRDDRGGDSSVGSVTRDRGGAGAGGAGQPTAGLGADDDNSGAGRDPTDPRDAPSATPNPTTAPDQGVEAGTGSQSDRVVDAATALEREVLDRFSTLDGSDVRVTRSGDTLEAELTRTGEEQLTADARQGGDARLLAEARRIEQQRAISAAQSGGDRRLRTEATPNVEGGDIRLEIAEREAREEAAGEVRSELSQEIDFSFGLGDPNEDEVEQFIRNDVTGATSSFFDRAVENIEVATTEPDSFGDRAADDAIRDAADLLGNAPATAVDTVEAGAGIGRDALIIQTNPTGSDAEEAAIDRNIRRGELVVKGIQQTATDVQENPSEIGGVASQAGIGLVFGTTASRAVRSTTGLQGPDLSRRAARSAADAASRARAAASRGASSVGDAAPRVDVSVDPDAPPVLLESDPLARASLPDTPDITTPNVDVRQSTAATAEVLAGDVRRAAGSGVDSAREAVAEVVNADPSEFVPDIDDVSNRARVRAGAADAPTSRRVTAADAAVELRDRLPGAPSTDSSLSGLFGRAGLRAGAADAPTTRRITAFDTISTVRSRLPDTPDANTGLLGLFGRANLRAEAADAPTSRRLTVADAAEEVRDLIPSSLNRDVGFSGAVSRANLRAELADAPTSRRVTAADAGAEFRDRVPDSIGDLTDVTVRVGDPDRNGEIEVRIPEQDADLGPFADEGLGDLGTGRNTGTDTNTDGAPTDVDTGGSDDGAVTVARTDTNVGRGQADSSTNRGSGDAPSADTGLGFGLAAAAESTEPAVDERDVIDTPDSFFNDQFGDLGTGNDLNGRSEIDQPTETDLPPDVDQPTDFETEIESRVRPDTRTDVDVRTDVDADAGRQRRRELPELIDDVDTDSDGLPAALSVEDSIFDTGVAQNFAELEARLDRENLPESLRGT